jgi:hypothetical protein
MSKILPLVRIAVILLVSASASSCYQWHEYCDSPWIRWSYGITSLGATEIMHRCISPDTTRRAMEGDADEMYFLAHNSKVPSARQEWLCRAAHAGHVNAQFEMGLDREKSEDDAKRNKVRAFIWYSLAVQGDHADAAVYRNDLENRMTSDELSEARLLVTDWKPRPQECD